MHLTKLDVHLARGIFKRLQAAVFELGAMGPAREKSIGGQKRSSESATKGKELDAARAVMKGLRVKNALLEAKLGEVETRASAKGEESTRLKELERTLGEERKRMRRVEEERAKTRTASEAERARLRCEVEDISRELRAKSASILLPNTELVSDLPFQMNCLSPLPPRITERVHPRAATPTLSSRVSPSKSRFSMPRYCARRRRIVSRWFCAIR